MDDIVSQFLSKGTVAIAVIVVMGNFFIKRTVEIIWPGLKPVAKEMDPEAMYRSKAALYWNTLGLYALPVLLGVLIGILFKEPFLFGDIQTGEERITYAAITGWFADFLYELFQKTLYNKTGVKLPDPDERVPSIAPPREPKE